MIYAGALDLAVGPRWHSVYEMACNVVTMFLEGAEVHAVPQGGTTERESARCSTNTGALGETDADELVDALIRQHEPAYIEKISKLLLAGTSPRRIVDAIQLAAAQVVLETRRRRMRSRCRSTPTNIATRSAGSTTISRIRSV